MEKSWVYRFGQIVIAVIVFAVLMAAIGMMTGCGGSRKMVRSTTTVKSDSVKVKEVKTASNTRIEKDVIGYLGGGSVKLHVSVNELSPVYDLKGLNVPRWFFASNENTHIKGRINGDGSIDIECTSDSLLQVIQRYILDSSVLQHRVDSLKDSKSETLVQVAARDNRTWFGKLRDYTINILAVIGAIAVIGLVVKKWWS